MYIDEDCYKGSPIYTSREDLKNTVPLETTKNGLNKGKITFLVL
jgi:hypothetical protein